MSDQLIGLIFTVLIVGALVAIVRIDCRNIKKGREQVLSFMRFHPTNTNFLSAVIAENVPSSHNTVVRVLEGLKSDGYVEDNESDPPEFCLSDKAGVYKVVLGAQQF